MCRPPGVGGGTNAPGGGVTGDGTGAVATTVNITGTVTGEAPVAFIVTVALWLPTVKVPVLTVSVTAPFPVPEAGLSLNQAALSLAVQLSVPPPVLLMLKVWVAGLVPPCVAAKERLVGLTPMAGGTGAVVTVNVTGTVTEDAPVAFIVTVALWLPTVKVPVLTVSDTAPFPVPETGLSVNQAALSLAVQLSVPPPALLILKVWVAGLAPPCVAAKERLVGLAPMTGSTTGGGAPTGVKVARLLSADSLFAKS